MSNNGGKKCFLSTPLPTPHAILTHKITAIQNLPSFKLLVDDEKVLSSSLNLIPMCYMTVKTSIFREPYKELKS